MEEKSEPQKKQNKFGAGFYIVLVFAAIKDISDLIFTFFLVTAPLTFVTGVAMSMVLWSYFFFIGVSLDSRKLATFLIAAIIEIMPLGGILPMATANLVAIRILENSAVKIPGLPAGKNK